MGRSGSATSIGLALAVSVSALALASSGGCGGGGSSGGVSNQPATGGSLVSGASGSGGTAAGPVPPVTWDADAGLVRRLSTGGLVETTSNLATAQNVIDADVRSFWQSGAPRPTGYFSRPDLNLVLDAVAAGRVRMSAGSNAAGATDTSPYTSARIDVGGFDAWFEVDLAAESSAHALSLRLHQFTTDVLVTALSASGPVVVGAVTPAQSHQTLRLPVPAGRYTGFRLSSSDGFSLTTLAVQSQIGFEEARVDLGSLQQVGWIQTRHFAGGRATATTLSVSQDGSSWTQVAQLDPAALGVVSTRLSVPVQARYVKVRHHLVDEDYAKVYVWEISVYDADGPFGPAPQPRHNPRSMRELLGVNGIWGWGTQRYSEGQGVTEGPGLYARVASHGRNYHNMVWDVLDPDNTPDYTAMAAGQGTEAQWWLSWDREYQAWQDAGLEVQASIQFVNHGSMAEAAWDDPHAAGYGYGFAFAEHFGPGSGNGLVTAMEVGNEPWGYPADFYRRLLAGMASGAKAADPDMIVMPAAFQAHQREDPNAARGNYIGARVSENEAPDLDAINGHYYSYRIAENGVRVATHPEHPESFMHGARNLLRWRDHNLADRPVYITEWGWDSDGVGEDGSFPECVSAEEQAVYGVRGALMYARYGVDRLTWFFYANDPTSNTLYTRSGLTGSATTGFAPKPSFRAFEAVVNGLGDAHFLEVLREDDDAWIYLLGTGAGRPTHVVAWRPVPLSDTSTRSVLLSITHEPARAWTIRGRSATGELAALPLRDSRGWTLEVSAVPLVVELAP